MRRWFRCHLPPCDPRGSRRDRFTYAGGFGAGGAIDVIARMLVEGMKDHAPAFHRRHRPGASGRLALGALKGSAARWHDDDPDARLQRRRIPHVYKSLGYDAFTDFAPVTTVCSFPFLITVGPMVPAARQDAGRLRDMVRGKSEAGDLRHGGGGIDAAFHRRELAKAGRFDFVHLPYGGPGGMQDLIGGRIAATIYPIGTALPHVQSGAVRALATTGRSALHKLPTCRRSAKPDIRRWRPMSGLASSFRRIPLPER